MRCRSRRAPSLGQWLVRLALSGLLLAACRGAPGSAEAGDHLLCAFSATVVWPDSEHYEGGAGYRMFASGLGVQLHTWPGVGDSSRPAFTATAGATGVRRLEPGTYQVQMGSVTTLGGPTRARSGELDVRNPGTTPGTLVVQEVRDSTLIGRLTLELAGRDLAHPGVLLTADFVAVPGSVTDSGSRFSRCLATRAGEDSAVTEPKP